MLDANRETHHVFSDSRRLQLVGAQLAVRGGGRVAGQRLGITNVDQAQDHLQRIDEPCTGFLATLDTETQDARGLAPGDLLGDHVIRAVGQTRVADPLDLRVILEVPGHGHGVLDVALHADGQCLDALQDEEGVERADGRAGVAQGDRAGAGDHGGRSEGFGVLHAVVGRLRLAEHGVAIGVVGPGELAGVDDHVAGLQVGQERLDRRVDGRAGDDQHECADTETRDRRAAESPHGE